MEIPTKFRSVSAGFRYWLLALVLLAFSTILISCGGDETTITITGGGSGGADTLDINAPSSVDTGGTATISVFATAAGVAVDGETITFQINPNQSGSNLSALIATTVNGVASVTYTAGTFNIPASDTIVISGTNDLYTLPDGTCTTDSTNLPNVPGCTFAIGVLTPGLDTVEVTATPDTLEAVAVGNNQATIEALVTAAGTPLELVAVDFTTTAGSICTVGAAPCTGQEVLNVQTGANGIARITLQSSTNLETATVTAQAGFTRGSTNVTFISGPAASFTLNANPVNITADGFSTSEVSTLVRDSADHIVADGAVVNFSVNTTTSTGTGDFQFPSSDETVGGIASRTFTAGVTFGDIDVVVSSGGADSGTDGDGLITLIQEIVGTVTVVVEPNSLVANGAPDNTVVVRATLTNSSGFPMNAGTEVTISTSGGFLDDVTPIANPVTSIIATTDNLGVASVFLQSSTTAGLNFVTATSGGRVGIGEVNFVAGPTDAAQSQLTVSPTNIPADGVTTATITLTAKDANGNLVADGKTVLFQSDDPNAVISDQTLTSGGIATATITSSTTPGTVNLDALIDGQTVTGCPSCIPTTQTSIDFGATAVGNPDSILLNLTGGSDADPDIPGSGSGTNLTVESPGGSNAITIEATVNDTSGLPIGVDCTDNITFAIIAGPGDIKLDGEVVASVIKTTAGGVASVSLTAGTTSGTVRVQVTAAQDSSDCASLTPTTVSATTTAITIGSGPAATLVLFPEANLIDEPGTSLTSWIFNAIVTDLYGNPVQDGTAVSFSLTSSAPGAQVCPEGFTGTATNAGDGTSENPGDCAGTTTALNGVARTKFTWPPDLIWAENFDLYAETSGTTVDDMYPNTSYPAVAPITITVEMTPSSVLQNGSAFVKVTYTDGSSDPIAIPIEGRFIQLFDDSAEVTTTDPDSATDLFGVTSGSLTVVTVGCVETDTEVTITAADDGTILDPTPAPYSGTGTFTIKGAGAGNCP